MENVNNLEHTSEQIPALVEIEQELARLKKEDESHLLQIKEIDDDLERLIRSERTMMIAEDAERYIELRKTKRRMREQNKLALEEELEIEKILSRASDTTKEKVRASQSSETAIKVIEEQRMKNKIKIKRLEDLRYIATETFLENPTEALNKLLFLVLESS